MRYISPYGRLKLYKENGDLAYSFEQHSLVLKYASADVDYIDATTKTDGTTLMRVYDKPINAGGPKELLEKCGLGYLTPDNSQWRLFYESPLVQSAQANPFDTYWMVEAGKVTYKGIEYKIGEIIKLASGDSLSLSGANYISQWFFPAMLKVDQSIDYTSLFKLNNLLVGDESPKYWGWGEAYTPTNSIISSDPNWFGWIRD
ncbi:hypothetical protein [Caldisericum sp.]|uniref:hypothetical protein n=1 Tax=Caldisericum sp. TaxID=2499687 RepID=UPI003D147957